MVLCEFTMSPLGKGESVSPYVARVLRVVDKSGINYMLTPMGTVLEGSWDEVMTVIRSCYRELEQDCNRITVSVKVDYRKGDQSRLKSKIEKVESIVGKPLSRFTQSTK